MKYIFDLNTENCVGCGACSVACMDQNDTDTERGEKPFRVVSTLEQGYRGETRWSYISVACMHCEDAPCIKACPCGCLFKDEETNFTIYDNTNCIGCHSCAMACPFGAPRFNEEGKMVKCDGCNDRVKAGLKPACVKVCPFDALKMYSEEEYKQAHPARGIHDIVQQLLRQE
jgi:Fe-S-cluster-containing dehydrogenase component